MRGAPKKQAEDVKRNRTIKVSDKNWERVKKEADKLGLSVNAYVNLRILALDNARGVGYK